MRYPRLLEAQGGAAASTTVDFLVTIGNVELFHSWYLLATVLGNAAGATNFYLGRHYVFRAPQQGAPAQGVRYLLCGWAVCC